MPQPNRTAIDIEEGYIDDQTKKRIRRIVRRDKRDPLPGDRDESGYLTIFESKLETHMRESFK